MIPRLENIKITDCESGPELTNNILEFADGNIFRFDPYFETRIETSILQSLIKGRTEDEVYYDTLKWIKRQFKGTWSESIQYKFDVHYVRYARPNVKI